LRLSAIAARLTRRIDSEFAPLFNSVRHWLLLLIGSHEQRKDTRRSAAEAQTAQLDECSR